MSVLAKMRAAKARRLAAEKEAKLSGSKRQREMAKKKKQSKKGDNDEEDKISISQIVDNLLNGDNKDQDKKGDKKLEAPTHFTTNWDTSKLDEQAKSFGSLFTESNFDVDNPKAMIATLNQAMQAMYLTSQRQAFSMAEEMLQSYDNEASDKFTNLVNTSIRNESDSFEPKNAIDRMLFKELRGKLEEEMREEDPNVTQSAITAATTEMMEDYKHEMGLPSSGGDDESLDTDEDNLNSGGDWEDLIDDMGISLPEPNDLYDEMEE